VATTLYERLGGEETIAGLVDRFYDRVLADEQLAPFFSHASMDSLRTMQRAFFAAALDGPVEYPGVSLADAHQGRGIERAHFRRFVDHLFETLQDYELSREEVDRVVERVATYVGEVVGEVGASG
jgi:hemoglobin